MSMTPKERYAEAVISLTKNLAAVMDDLIPLYSEYFDNGYNSGGADQIEDADVSENNTTATEIANAITMIENLEKFLNNNSPSAADYSVTVNQLRRAGRR